ncbi:hypothetical protein ACFONG_19115 [Uliginosibacterium paludis]|uniref:DUF3325 domain-containing protein n=1 Tax=Uliginosibacterium paludis TaxID=1615952 RepID=A0ABV2CU85_9RHOO
MAAWIVPGLLLTLAGSLAVYLASPHQRLIARPLGAVAARASGGLLCAAGLLCLLGALQAVAAVLVFATWLMLLFVIWPYAGVLAATRQK